MGRRPFVVEGGGERGARFLDPLEMCFLTANLGDSRTIAPHPAGATHGKLLEEERWAGGIRAGLVCISIGLEAAEDIVADLDQALDQSAGGEEGSPVRRTEAASSPHHFPPRQADVEGRGSGARTCQRWGTIHVSFEDSVPTSYPCPGPFAPEIDRSSNLMDRWLRWARRIDRMNEWAGRALYWLTLGMVGVGAFNAIARYLGKYIGLGLSSNMWIEMQWYFFSLVFLLGAAYTLKYDDHVRVDVLYSRLSRRGQAWINVLGTVLFLIPFCTAVLWHSVPFVSKSWATLEQSPDPGGLARYPIKTVIPLALVLVIAQGVALMIREIAVLRGYDVEEEAERESRPRVG